MKQRVKYPLTLEAKEAAKMLVETWDSGILEQRFYISETRADGHKSIAMFTGGIDFTSQLQPPPVSILLELSEYNLVRMQGNDVLMLQELRNAVENDFDVSDFFLTTSAVGTVVYGNLDVREGAIMQSQANIYGDNTQNANQLADDLLELLGVDLLQSEPDLNAAIIALKSMDELSRREKCGKVIQELGRCMGHAANAGTVLMAISMAVQFAG